MRPESRHSDVNLAVSDGPASERACSAECAPGRAPACPFVHSPTQQTSLVQGQDTWAPPVGACGWGRTSNNHRPGCQGRVLSLLRAGGLLPDGDPGTA